MTNGESLMSDGTDDKTLSLCRSSGFSEKEMKIFEKCSPLDTAPVLLLADSKFTSSCFPLESLPINRPLEVVLLTNTSAKTSSNTSNEEPEIASNEPSAPKPHVSTLQSKHRLYYGRLWAHAQRCTRAHNLANAQVLYRSYFTSYYSGRKKDVLRNELSSVSSTESYTVSLPISRGFLVVDPNNDLPDTVKRLSPIISLLTRQKTSNSTGIDHGKDWICVKQTIPKLSELTSNLFKSSVFFYAGHNGGEQFWSDEALRDIQHGKPTFLMGCSSGKLRYSGLNGCDYEPGGISLAHLSSGSPAVVSSLWQVSDNDVDVMSMELLEIFTGLTLEKNQELSKDVQQSKDMKEDQQQQKDKTKHEKQEKKKKILRRKQCLLQKEHCPAHPMAKPWNLLPHRSEQEISLDSLQNFPQKQYYSNDLLAAMIVTRQVCKLPYLNGAAFICYGIPIRFDQPRRPTPTIDKNKAEGKSEN